MSGLPLTGFPGRAEIDSAVQRNARRAQAFRLKAGVILAFFAFFIIISDEIRLRDLVSGGGGGGIGLPLDGGQPAVGGGEVSTWIPEGVGWGARRGLLKKEPPKPEPEEEEDKCGSIINEQKDRCAYVKKHCLGEGEGMIDYARFHYCTMKGREGLSIGLLVGVVMLAFYLLGETAEEYFCPVVKKITHVLDLAPNTAGVTFLAFGNGAPDVFASLAAFVGGDGKIGLGAIVSAGSFVAAFVVGSVAMASAPVEVKPRPYVRDVMFYLVGAVGVFFVTITGEIRVWQAATFLAYYVFFVLVVVVSDRIEHHKRMVAAGKETPHRFEHAEEVIHDTFDTSETTAWVTTAMVYKAGGGGPQPRAAAAAAAVAAGGAAAGGAAAGGAAGVAGVSPKAEGDNPLGPHHPHIPLSPDRALLAGTWQGEGHPEPPLGVDGKGNLAEPSFLWVLRTYWSVWWADYRQLSGWERCKAAMYQPFDIARRATIPTVEEEEWNKLYAAINTMLGPLVVLNFFGDFVDFSHPVGRVGHWLVPLWLVVWMQGTLLAVAQWHSSSYHRTPSYHSGFVAMAFFTSIAWISGAAQELLGCLSALGTIIGISPSILGVTVLAWGNSVGDLVADVAIARAGEPSMAVAGCYAGPMFNMLIGLGMAFFIKTLSIYPAAYQLHYHPNVPMSFGFLFATLIGSLVTVPLSGFRLTKPWGICLIALYLIFMLLSVCVEAGLLVLH